MGDKTAYPPTSGERKRPRSVDQRKAAWEAFQSADVEAMRLARSYRLMAKAHVEMDHRTMSVNPTRYFDAANAIEAVSQAFEELEAQCCPEDIGFVEYIAVLERQLADERAAHEVTRRAMVLAAIPLEVLHATEADGKALCQEVKDDIAEAVAAIRAALPSATQEEPR